MISEALRRSAAHVFVASLDAPVLSDDDAHHLGRVLRLRDGEKVSVSDGRGSWVMGEWHDGTVVVDGSVQTTERSSQRCAVAMVPVKGDRTEGAIEKLVEIGIDEIVIVAPTAHSVVRWDDQKWSSMMDRYSRVARAAAMQSRRVFLPEVSGPASFDSIIARPAAAIAEPGGDADWSDVRCVVIGPEGGFSRDEAAAAHRRVDLGATVLRADTAAIVAATRLLHRV